MLFVGEKEIQNKLYTLKNLTTGAEQSVSVTRIITSVKDVRAKDSF